MVDKVIPFINFIYLFDRNKDTPNSMKRTKISKKLC